MGFVEIRNCFRSEVRNRNCLVPQDVTLQGRSRCVRDAEISTHKQRPLMAISRQDLARDRAFWNSLLALNAELGGLRPHCAAMYRNRRFVIIRDAAWISLYPARFLFPQIGVFLRCAGLASKAFFMLADQARPHVEPRLQARSGRRA
jgi:hypothetical protein